MHDTFTIYLTTLPKGIRYHMEKLILFLFITCLSAKATNNLVERKNTKTHHVVQAENEIDKSEHLIEQYLKDWIEILDKYDVTRLHIDSTCQCDELQKEKLDLLAQKIGKTLIVQILQKMIDQAKQIYPLALLLIPEMKNKLKKYPSLIDDWKLEQLRHDLYILIDMFDSLDKELVTTQSGCNYLEPDDGFIDLITDLFNSE